MKLGKLDWIIIGCFIILGILAIIFSFYPEYGVMFDFSTWIIDTNFLGATLLTVFIVCVIGNLLPFPTPYTFIIIPAALSFPVFFWLIALVASVGALIGEIQGYFVGRGSHEVLKRRGTSIEKVEDWKKLIETRPRLVMFLIFLFGLTPLNDDNIMIPIGLAGFDFKRTVFSCYLGKLGMMMAMALGGAFGIELLEKLAGTGGANPFGWVEGLIVLAITLVIIWLMFKIDIKRFLKEKYGVEAFEDEKEFLGIDLEEKPFIIQAHRGASGYEFENSYSAFNKAVELGAQLIETDVRETADGQLVLMHDVKVNRTTSGKGKVKDLTLQQIKTLKLKNGEEIPLLEEVFVQFREKIRFNLEIKVKNIERKLFDLITKYNLREKILISSFSFKTLQTFHEIDPKLQLALIISYPWTFIKLRYSFDKLVRNGIRGVNPLYLFVIKGFVKKAHEYGIKVYPWPVNRLKTALKFKNKYQTDGLITNYPDILQDSTK